MVFLYQSSCWRHCPCSDTVSSGDLKSGDIKSLHQCQTRTIRCVWYSPDCTRLCLFDLGFAMGGLDISCKLGRVQIISQNADLSKWNDGRMIALLVLAGVLLLGFVLVQIFLPKTATIPPRIFKQRSILAGFFYTICSGSQMMIFSKFQ